MPAQSKVAGPASPALDGVVVELVVREKRKREISVTSISMMRIRMARVRPRLRGSQTPAPFPGRVRILDGNPVERKQSDQIADDEMKFMSTPEVIKLAFFVDGSFRRKSEQSGVAVVFRRFRPGSAHDGMKVQMAFPLCDSTALDNNIAEMIALLQGILVALEELEQAGPLSTRRVEVMILSDSEVSLRAVIRLYD